MNEYDTTLCNRILEKCQGQRWYAGDKHNTAQYRLSPEKGV